MFSHLRLSPSLFKTSLASDQIEATQFHATWGLQGTSQSLEQRSQLTLQNADQLQPPKLQQLQLQEQMGPAIFKRLSP